VVEAEKMDILRAFVAANGLLVSVSYCFYRFLGVSCANTPQNFEL
jgi:hypothetical protein